MVYKFEAYSFDTQKEIITLLAFGIDDKYRQRIVTYWFGRGEKESERG